MDDKDGPKEQERVTSTPLTMGSIKLILLFTKQFQIAAN